MTEQNLRARVQLPTQAAALLIVMVYVAGFLTISLYHASFGISLQFNLFRPRILSAGTIFIVLTALGTVVAAQIFGLWNSSHTPGHMHQGEPLPDSRNTQTETTLPTFASRAVFFVYFAVFLSIMIGQYLFSNGPEWIDKVGLWGLGLFLPGPALGVLAAFQTRRRPWLSVALSLLAIMLIGFSLWRIHDATLTALLAWFCLGAFTAHSLRELIANPSRLKDVNWHWGLGLSP